MHETWSIMHALSQFTPYRATHHCSNDNSCHQYHRDKYPQGKSLSSPFHLICGSTTVLLWHRLSGSRCVGDQHIQGLRFGVRYIRLR